MLFLNTMMSNFQLAVTASFLKAMSWWSHDLPEKRLAVWIISNLYWFKSFQWEGMVWQRIIEKIVKASIQVTMSAISMTRFLDPDTTSFPSKNAWGSISWVRILSGSRPAKSKKKPCCNFRHKLIRDWSIARTHHKRFVEVWWRHARLEKWLKEIGYKKKHAVGLLLQKSLKRRKDAQWTAPQTTA